MVSAAPTFRPYFNFITNERATSPYSIAARVRAMIGGFAWHRPQLCSSVASSGIPHCWQPESPHQVTPCQHAEQKVCISATIDPQPAQRGGSAKSTAKRAPSRRILEKAFIGSCCVPIGCAQARRDSRSSRQPATGSEARARRAARRRSISPSTRLRRLSRPLAFPSGRRFACVDCRRP